MKYLILQPVADDKLDFQEGLQFLYAAYNSEKLLCNLTERNYRFNITFFESYRSYVPASTNTSLIT